MTSSQTASFRPSSTSPSQPASPRASPAVERQRALLTAACRRDVTAGVLVEQSLILEEADTRERFVRFANSHGVLGLVLCAMQRAHRHEGRRLSRALQEILDGLRRHAAVVHFERDHILGILQRASLDPVVLKGAGLASTVYREVAERPIADLDLLLHREQTDAALRALGAEGYREQGSEAITAGYRAHHFHVRVQRPGELIVELHWGLTHRRETEQLDPEAFLAESVFVANEPAYRVPRAELALLHIVVEQVRDGFSRLLAVVDVDRIVTAAPAMDWRYLIESARAGQVTSALALALALSRKILGTEVPAAVREQIRPSAAVRFHLATLCPVRSLLEQRSQTSASWGDLLHLCLLPGRHRRSALTGMMSGGGDDPLEWLWAGESVPRPSGTTVGRRVLRVGKVLGYQLGLYPLAFGRRLRGASQWEAGFW